MTGPGGAGKTSLAVELARRLVAGYPDGVWLVELAALRDRALLAEAVAAALGLSGEAGRAGGPAAGRGRAAGQLRGRQGAAAGPGQLRASGRRPAPSWPGGCSRPGPAVRVVATSREVLGVPGEVVWPVPPLAVPAPPTGAGAGVRPGRAPTATRARPRGAGRLRRGAAVRRAGRRRRPRLRPGRGQRAGGGRAVPAPGRAAAGHRAGRGPGPGPAPGRAGGPAGRPVPAAGRRRPGRRRPPADPAGHRRLELGAARRAATGGCWRRLSVFSGGWTVAAAEAVCGGDGLEPGEVLEGLFRLVDRSLVVAAGGGPARFTMLETLRAYGAERLAEAGETQALAARHTAWCLELAEQAAAHRTARPWLRLAQRRLRQPAGGAGPGDGRPRPGHRAAAGRRPRLVLVDRPHRRGPPAAGRRARPGRRPAAEPAAGQGAAGGGDARGAAHPDRRRPPTPPGAAGSCSSGSGTGGGPRSPSCCWPAPSSSGAGPARPSSAWSRRPRRPSPSSATAGARPSRRSARFTFETYSPGAVGADRGGGAAGAGPVPGARRPVGGGPGAVQPGRDRQGPRRPRTGRSPATRPRWPPPRDGGPLWVMLASLGRARRPASRLRGDDARAAALQSRGGRPVPPDRAAPRIRPPLQRAGRHRPHPRRPGTRPPAATRRPWPSSGSWSAGASPTPSPSWPAPRPASASSTPPRPTWPGGGRPAPGRPPSPRPPPWPWSARPWSRSAADRPEQAARLLAAAEATRERTGVAATGAEAHEAELAGQAVRGRARPGRPRGRGRPAGAPWPPTRPCGTWLPAPDAGQTIGTMARTEEPHRRRRAAATALAVGRQTPFEPDAVDGPSPFPPIAEYAFLSDCETNALVAPSGNVEWLCSPRPDGRSVFASMLDRAAGSFRLGPTGVMVPAGRRYLPGTLVLETTWRARRRLDRGPGRDVRRPLVPPPAPLGDPPPAPDRLRGRAHPAAHGEMHHRPCRAQPGLRAGVRLRPHRGPLGVLQPGLRGGDRPRGRGRRPAPAGHRPPGGLRGPRRARPDHPARGRPGLRRPLLAALPVVVIGGVLGRADAPRHRRRGVRAHGAHRRVLAGLDQPGRVPRASAGRATSSAAPSPSRA